jgi:hypothetical protein
LANASSLLFDTSQLKAFLTLFPLNFFLLFLGNKQTAGRRHRNATSTTARRSIHETTKILLLTTFTAKRHFQILLLHTVSTSTALSGRVLRTVTTDRLNLGHGQEK